MRQPDGPPRRRPAGPTPICSLAPLWLALLLAMAACAPLVAADEVLSGAAAEADEPAASGEVVDAGDWLLYSRAGREALRQRDYAAAERSFVAALVAAAGRPDYDVRIHTTLGNLVGIAAAHQRQGRDAEAERVLSIVERNAGSSGSARLGHSSYRARYLSLVEPPQHVVRWPVQRPARARRSLPTVRSYDHLIAHAARSHRVDPALVKAVVAAESNFERDAVSRVGAQGLMQLMPATARAMGVRSPFEPSDNLNGGVRYLREMLDRYGNVPHALAAYNAGPEAVDRHGGVPPFRETREYVQRVLGYYRGYLGNFSN